MLLDTSPKASAALGRRCLRNLLHHLGFQASDLSTEIDILLATKHLPMYLAGWLLAVREIGKFDVHPAKSTQAAEIQDAEPGESECLLDALDGLCGFYFVQPAEMKRKQEELQSRFNLAWKDA